MAELNEQILAEVKELKSWLYGENGFEGDIPEIKKTIKGNQEAHDVLAGKHEKLSTHFWQLVGILVGSGVLGGGAIAALNVMK